ncbi:hypothetical protein E3P89_02948 [Wallemia ichthyophaga]|uniref:Proteasome activator complex subunit 4 n=1 Tax=Wallemia ichthyophaga TaxID=245174 RepID=A0A4T0I0K4_WALIC|nr:hypothetical protein E3P90_03560 [Wallemia ichthyophaga]TIB10224.1 hypothetical protein E3P93_02973 [Wallemia ichthyophaga]TIB20902.1 hypothetical protein E3P89_02948 [Wallemia ichthyophaga]TIB21275.1 hypothetical protein E3P88_03574 [Wallemia ichthyophaga]
MKPSAGRDEDSRVKATHQFKHIPYQVESLEEMDSRLDHIIHKLINAAKANDWDISFSIWDHRLQAWLSLKYPMTRERRVQLTRLYYQLLVTPGMDGRFINLFANRLMSLISSKKRISIKDIVLPWKPLYDILSTELFPKQRETSRKNITNNLLTLTEYAQRFFHPSEYQNMLDTILPQMDGSSVDSIISTQAFLVQFLPLSHPQYWLPITFRIWETFNSSHIDDQHLDLVARLTEKHLDPSISDPRFIDSLAPAPSDIPSVGRPPKDKSADSSWKGIRKDIGILTEAQFDTVMQKALSSFNIAVGKLRGGDTLGPDGKISQNVLNLKKPTNRTFSLAIILVYSMSQDAGVAASSAAGTPISETPVNKSKNQLSAPTVGGSSAFNKHLGGSKALDALNKLILNTETYFHPSNWGAHTFALTYFISDTSSLFLERWNDEQKPDCKTPLQWRLTKQMKKEFVHSLRTVALLSMFSKSCLRNLALLEPDLIYPALMERAYPSLEALTETHRTSAVITALSTVAPHLVSRSKYYAGAKDLLPLLEFSLPGIDMNDPTKTIATCMFIITSLHSVRIGDATSEGSDEVDAHRRKSVNPMDLDGCAPIEVSSPVETSFPEGREANDPPLTPEEADNLIRTSTSSFGDWVIEFFRRVFILCENLPEEGGKHNRVGGRIEESVIHTLMSACEVVCGALSPPIFQLALKQVFQYVSTTTRANSVRVIGQLVSCFAKADAEKTLKQFLGWSISTVKIELHHGASGERTTSTSTPFAGDTSLHWALAVLTGCLSHCGKALLAYKSDIVDILKLTATACKSERGYMWSSSVLQRVLQTLVQYYTTSTRFVNDEEWNSPSFARNHFQHWGRLYEGGDVDVEWHIPSLEEFDMAVELFEQILEPEMKDLDNLSSTSTKSKDWSNDFCRKTLHLRHSLTAIASLLQTEAPDKGREVSDWGEFPQNFVEKQPPFKSQGVLSEDDPRIQYFNQFRFRFGELLHKVARTFTNPNEQNESSDSIDCVKAFLRSLRVFMSENGMDSTHYENTRRRYTFHKSVNKIIPRQKEWPRMTFVRRASYLHATRLHLNTFNRQRSQLDDMLLDDVLELSLSSYTAVRKTAQNTLHQLAVFYDGTKALSMDKILDALKPGVDVDRKKGALFVLMNKSWVSYYLLHFDQFKRTILALLSAQTEEKPSIQNLIQNLSREVVVRMPEINALTSRLKCKQTENVIEKLEKELGGESVDSQELIAEVANAAAGRVEHREELYEELMPQVLEFAESSNTHWRYQLIAQRVLKNLIRRDKPMSERLTRYFLANTISDHPKIREHAYGSITKILHFVKLRTFGQGTNLNEKLLLKSTKNPLKKTVKIEDDASFTTDKYLNQFKQPISDWSSDVLLQDKAQSGWLCWGPSLEVYELPPVNRFPFEWENESSASVQAITETVMSIDWWNKFISQLSIESSSTTPSYDHVNFIKSIFAMSEKPLTLLKTVIEPLLEDVGDRHKQRAASELLSGLLRGVKHWPKYASDDLWSWFTPKLDFLSNVRPDSAATWEVFVINALYHRDPRRLLPLVSWIVNRGDLNRNASSSAWSQAYSINLLRLVVKTVSWRFSAWSAEIGDMYWSFDALNHDYAEVRANIAKTLQKLNRSQLHPSFANVGDLQRVSETVPSDKIIIKHNVEQKTLEHIRNIKKYLAFEYNNRLPPPKSSLSTYDKIGLTILRFIWDALHDSTRCSFYPISIELLPDFFNMRELSDSPDLQATAQSVLSLFAVIPPPREYSEPVVRTLLDVVGSSTRYRVRLHALPITVAVFYFFQLPHISQSTTLGVMEELYKLLRDQNIEVRERAAETLSGIVRCSQRSYTLDLKKRFTDTVSAHSLLPRRRMESGEVNSSYAPAVLKLHSGILGICALINAFPYDVPSWMPELLTGVLAEHVSSSDTVISSTIRKTAQDWRRTHQDSWSENIHKFSEEQLSELSSLFLGECYFA